ncbi:MAG: sn-glycerol-3-phosphate ABC transporter ATP-binding protein UgpC [Lautropia sp.]|nr:sn-glycerol-3-phosphate ABC transporter ATP-binding protein UgpC [Lautropia sp.]
MSKIELKNVTKKYTPKSLTINNANLTIEHGEFCVFVGPSGCGKSTLLRMVAGLEDITSGDLYIDGERMNDLHPSERGVAMVFQSYALYPHMTVKENMAFGLKVSGSNQAEIDRRVNEAARALQLEPLLERLPKALSGGQRQRVAIGRAIVKEPKVFLFDEPLSNLDAALRVQTRLEIAKLHERIGTASMIYVTHDQVEAMTLAHKIVLLHAGERVAKRGSVAQVGTPLELYHRPNSLFVAEFIGSPKMNILPGSLVSATPERAQVKVGDATLHARVDATRVKAGEPVKLGIRPERVQIVSEPGNNTLPGQIMHVERVGDSSYLYVETMGTSMFTVKVPNYAAQAVGQNLLMHLPETHIHLFDDNEDACHRTVELPSDLHKKKA